MDFPPALTKKTSIQAGLFLSAAALGEVSKFDFATQSELETNMHYYGTDLLYPFGLYFFTRYLGLSRKASLITWGTLSTLSEISDLFDGGVYDYKDFLAYGLALTGAYFIDKRVIK